MLVRVQVPPSAPKPQMLLTGLLGWVIKASNKIQTIDLYVFIFIPGYESFLRRVNWCSSLIFRSIIVKLLGVLMPKSPLNHGFSLTPTGLLSIMPARI